MSSNWSDLGPKRPVRAFTMLNVLMVAEPFGYGPVATLLKCRRELAALPLRWRYLGPDYTRPLIEAGEFEACTFPAQFETIDVPEVHEALAWADVVFSGTEFRVIERAARLGKSIVVFDPLFWFWPSAPMVSVPGITYICQNFVGVTERVASLPPDQRCRFVVTPPFSAARSATRREATVIVNFCGVQNPVRPMDDAVKLVMRCLRPALDASTWERIVVVGNLPSSTEAGLGLDERRLAPSLWSHARMQNEMSRASLLLTCPGLNSVFEAICLGTPVAFLPPLNNSQAAQLDRFQAAGLSHVAMDWSSLTGLELEWNDPVPHRAFAELSRGVDACRNSRVLTASLTDALRTALTLSPTRLSEIAVRQRRFCEALCPPELPGLEEIWMTRVVPQVMSASEERS